MVSLQVRGLTVSRPWPGPSSVATVAIGEALIQLALTLVVAALPTVAVALGASPAETAWVLTAFLLPLAGGLLLAGRLVDLFGRRQVFLAGTALYAIGGASCALAGELLGLVVGRGLQGLGATLISGNNLAILAATVPPERRGRALGLIATLTSLAAVAGIGLGTAVVTVGAWRWLFLGALPLAGVAAWGGYRLAPEPPPRTTQVNWPGAALLVLGLTAIAVAHSHPHDSTTDAVMPVIHVGMPGRLHHAG